jgi:hypothetical protein
VTAGTRVWIVNRMGADCFSPGHVSAPRLGVAVAEIAAALSRLAETPEPDVIRTRIKAISVNTPRHAVDQIPNRLAVPDDRRPRNSTGPDYAFQARRSRTDAGKRTRSVTTRFVSVILRFIHFQRLVKRDQELIPSILLVEFLVQINLSPAFGYDCD